MNMIVICMWYETISKSVRGYKEEASLHMCHMELQQTEPKQN